MSTQIMCGKLCSNNICSIIKYTFFIITVWSASIIEMTKESSMTKEFSYQFPKHDEKDKHKMYS